MLHGQPDQPCDPQNWSALLIALASSIVIAGMAYSRQVRSCCRARRRVIVVVVASLLVPVGWLMDRCDQPCLRVATSPSLGVRDPGRFAIGRAGHEDRVARFHGEVATLVLPPASSYLASAVSARRHCDEDHRTGPRIMPCKASTVMVSSSASKPGGTPRA